MNKDIVGLIYRILCRINIDNVVKEYGIKFTITDIGFRCKSSLWYLNWRFSGNGHGKNIYDFRKLKPVGGLPKNY